MPPSLLMENSAHAYVYTKGTIAAAGRQRVASSQNAALRFSINTCELAGSARERSSTRAVVSRCVWTGRPGAAPKRAGSARIWCGVRNPGR